MDNQAEINEDLNFPNQRMILVAEDDAFNFLLIQSVLQRNHFNVLHAKNGFEAVKLYMDTPDICLIMMDLQMPVMDGFTATSIIRKKNKDIPVIAQTAYVVPGIRDKARKAGCNDFITKPFDPDLMINKINSLLNTVKL